MSDGLNPVGSSGRVKRKRRPARTNSPRNHPFCKAPIMLRPRRRCDCRPADFRPRVSLLSEHRTSQQCLTNRDPGPSATQLGEEPVCTGVTAKPETGRFPPDGRDLPLPRRQTFLAITKPPPARRRLNPTGTIHRMQTVRRYSTKKPVQRDWAVIC